VVFQVRQAAREHRLGVHLSLCLETPVLEEGLDEAMAILTDTLPVERVLFLYRNTHRLYPERVAYRLYDSEGSVKANSTTDPDPLLATLVEGQSLAEVEVMDMPSDWSTVDMPARLLSLVHSGRHEEVMGKFFFWLKPGGNVRAARQMLEVLRSAVVQRLGDFSKDARNLEKYFRPETVYRLLMEEDYESVYLSPKVQTVGVLFIDVAGFTRLSETALRKPEDTGRFIDLWSEGAARILMQHGGVMDKLIGDCVLGLFGPPFFARSPAQLAEATLRAALEIQDFTRELIDDEGLADLKESLLDAGGLDVSTGAAMGSVSVGLFGPNRDYTAFGSVINNCARIQGAAKPGQTLALKDLVVALDGREVGDFGFGETGEYRAKNVAEPLEYRVVTRPE
jgi:class 3 adenylate cyclase